MSLLVVTGPPGAGKSTVARILAADTSPSALVPGDAFFGFLYRGAVDPWLPGTDAQNTAVTEAAAMAAARLAATMDVVYEGVVGAWFLDTFATAAGAVDLDYVVLLPDEATCLRRVAERDGHSFTDPDAARHMHREFAAARLDARHVVTDSAGTAGDVAALVRHRRAEGRLTVRRRPAAP